MNRMMWVKCSCESGQRKLERTLLGIFLNIFKESTGFATPVITNFVFVNGTLLRDADLSLIVIPSCAELRLQTILLFHQREEMVRATCCFREYRHQRRP